MLSLRSLSYALTLTTLFACAAKGQSGSASVTAQGSVSETVILSLAPQTPLNANEATISYTRLDAQTILVSIKLSGNRGARIVIPAQIRSNVGFTLSASSKSSGSATLSHALRVTGARATGRFVAPDASEAVNASAATFNATADAGGHARRASHSAPLFNSTATLLTGPRISLAGMSDSPHNALEVMILAEVEASAEAERGGIELILSAQPSSAPSPALASR